MNYKELNNSLPNGLHDTDVTNIDIDYVNHVVTLTVNIWIGSMGETDLTKREERKQAEIIIRNFQYFVIDPPDPKYPYSESKPLWIDSGEFADSRTKPRFPRTSSKYFRVSFFVNNWNSFIYFAAEDIEIKWK